MATMQEATRYLGGDFTVFHTLDICSRTAMVNMHSRRGTIFHEEKDNSASIRFVTTRRPIYTDR